MGDHITVAYIIDIESETCLYLINNFFEIIGGTGL